MNDPYLLPSGALRNRLGIVDAAELAQAEADIANATLIRLAARPLPGGYDLDHLRAFHRAIFGPIYRWAGELRTVEIAKDTGFCPREHLVDYAHDLFGKLAASSFLRGLRRGEFVMAVADLYGDLNALHPFREGNGRTQRAFLSQLTGDAGFALSWAGLDPEQNRVASIRSFVGDNAALYELFDGLVT